MNLLLPEYEKEFRREKNFRVGIGVAFIAGILLAIGLVFMLPSYFALVFSKDDIARRLAAEEEVFGKKEFQILKTRIALINQKTLSFDREENKRRALAPILAKLAAGTPDGIRLTFINLSKNERGTFTLSLQGEASDRSRLLLYIDMLKGVDAFSAVGSPVSNLLKEVQVPFSLNIDIKPEFYKYDAG